MDRPSLRTLTEESGLVGCEVGVEYGRTSYQILTELDVKKMYLVDPYIVSSDEDIQGVFTNKPEARKAENEAKEKLGPFDNALVWIRKKSQDVTFRDISENSLDFVYIDGNHTKFAVLDDVRFFFRTVKPGGLVAGHDYGAPGSGVKEAVDEFYASRDDVGPFHTQVDALGGRSDWWFFKNFGE